VLVSLVDVEVPSPELFTTLGFDLKSWRWQQSFTLMHTWWSGIIHRDENYMEVHKNFDSEQIPVVKAFGKFDFND
jgi:hypothetical protein